MTFCASSLKKVKCFSLNDARSERNFDIVINNVNKLVNIFRGSFNGIFRG